MTKVLIEFDTVEKTITAKVGDKDMPNLSSIYVYQSYDRKDEYSIELCAMTRSKDDDMVEVYRVCASEGIVVKCDEDQEKTIAKLSQMLLRK